MKTIKNNIAVYALFISLNILLAQISIPLPFTPIPVNLTIVAVLISGAVLGAKGGVICQLIYIFMGAVGLPVFAGFRAGLIALLGPTGGYIIGYVIAALIVGLFTKIKNNLYFTFLYMLLGLFIIYIFGTIWFSIYSKVPITQALLMCVVPFILVDIFKVIISAIVAVRLKKIIPLFNF